MATANLCPHYRTETPGPMKRRTLILGSGGLAALSLGTTASMASFAHSVDIGADFRAIIPAPIVTSLEAVPNTENDLSEHTWEFEQLQIDTDIEEIQVDYPSGTEFDEVTTDTVTVRFQQGNNLRDVDVLSVTHSESSAIFELDPDDIGGSAEVIIDEIKNPDAGSYVPEIFLRAGDDEIDGDRGLVITDEDAEFDIEIDAPDDAFVGEELIVEYTAENVGEAIGSAEITFFVDGTEEGSTATDALDPGETETGSFDYDVVNDDDPSIDVEVTTNEDAADDTVEILGAWEIDPDPATENDDSIHTWSTEGIIFDGEIDEITIEYLDVNNRLNFDNQTDVTIEITRDGENSPSEIGFTESFDDSRAEFDLNDNEETTVDGEIVITIDDLRNPNQDGEYQGTIDLDGDNDEFGATVTFEIV